MWNNKGNLLNNLGRYEEALTCNDKAIELDPDNAYSRFNRSEACFAMHRWDDGFEAIRDAFAHAGKFPKYFGDVESMFSLIYRLSETDSQLQSRVDTLIDIYQQAAGDQGFCGQNRRGSGKDGEVASTPHAAGTAPRPVRPTVNPLAFLADGLVKSFGKIDAERVTSSVMESYVRAVEQRVSDIPELEIALRLFRYGIRYLISGNESAFVELIQPERHILRQALGISKASTDC